MPEIIILDPALERDPPFNEPVSERVRNSGFSALRLAYEAAPSQLHRLKKAGAIILAGSPLHYPYAVAEELEHYVRPVIRDLQVPMLGICLGLQVLGLAYGARMRRGQEKERGIITAEVNPGHEANLLFQGCPPNIELAAMHDASIDIFSAADLVCLASSRPKASVSETGCENQIIAVQGRPIYGVQAHPELPSSNPNILDNFLRLTYTVHTAC